jgi:hypothetical protein
MTNERPQRQRVVLAHRRGTRLVRTRVELQAQLGLALRLGALVLGGMVSLALLDSAFPAFSTLTVFGFRPNWLILGVLVYPMMYAVGRLYIRLAEQGERDFMRIVDAGEEQ